ncbi:(d)CMP kinase [Candidatus Pelagibacter sp.]|nr:(d)CMP kinase [Candidatus Pelagibacter sp.]
MKNLNKLIIACDGESASGKSTAAKLISKKYKLLLINSGLLYRYSSKLIIKHRPKNAISFLKNKFSNISYKNISKQRLHSEQISSHVAVLAKDKRIREIINKFQKKIIKGNKRICVEGRDIASKILAKNPKYDIAFYFKCNLNVASYRRWLDIKKKVSLKNVKKSLKNRTLQDKKRKNSPLIKVKNAILIRTDKLSKKEVLNKMSLHIEKYN